MKTPPPTNMHRSTHKPLLLWSNQMNKPPQSCFTPMSPSLLPRMPLHATGVWSLFKFIGGNECPLPLIHHKWRLFGKQYVQIWTHWNKPRLFTPIIQPTLITPRHLLSIRPINITHCYQSGWRYPIWWTKRGSPINIHLYGVPGSITTTGGNEYPM